MYHAPDGKKYYSRKLAVEKGMPDDMQKPKDAAWDIERLLSFRVRSFMGFTYHRKNANGRTR